ncbi:N-alpha-acetyltransferase 30 [Conger conger]|uniref:N-alpha-acetyltransferase 30 n=1 Tax=Conger conger TaxID=82655 RepID=UPI002A5A0334|nr:N-alpha-acetyltransferase 30 [Conger conger]XP_061104769.1 N-alpha-acetyltransferase 30 [Conger conger]
MAEVPPGPSALPASPAEIILFPGGVCAVPGEGEERGCGRGDTLVPGTGQQPQVSEGKGTSKTSQNHLYSHPAALNFHTPTQQQLNGLISSAEDGLLFSHHSRTHSHLHHPAHRPPDSQRGPVEHCDSASEAPVGAAENNNLNDRNCGDYQQEHSLRVQKNHSHSNNNSINSMLTMARTEATLGQLAGEELSRDGGHSRTEPQPSLDDPPDGEAAEGGIGPEMQRAGVELVAALDTAAVLQTPVSEMARLDLNSKPDGVDGVDEEDGPIQYVRYESELQMPDIMRLITKDLSEPYSIYTYRYFIHNWPQLCFLAMVQQECVGAIVCKLDMHKKMFRRGYIAMLAVDSKYRRKGIGTNLVKKAIYAMVEGDCDEVVLETEITNKSALKLYENLGFVRDKRLFRYYLNGVDALRLKLWLR